MKWSIARARSPSAKAVRHGDEQPALEGPDLRDVAGYARGRLVAEQAAMMRAANSEDMPRTAR
jgi:hypothetical protein